MIRWSYVFSISSKIVYFEIIVDCYTFNLGISLVGQTTNLKP